MSWVTVGVFFIGLGMMGMLLVIFDPLFDEYYSTAISTDWSDMGLTDGFNTTITVFDSVVKMMPFFVLLAFGLWAIINSQRQQTI